MAVYFVLAERYENERLSGKSFMLSGGESAEQALKAAINNFDNRDDGQYLVVDFKKVED